MREQAACSSIAAGMHRFISRNYRLRNAGCTVEPMGYSSHCFRVELPKSLQDNIYGIFSISCSVPFDCNRDATDKLLSGRMPEYINYETALFSKTGLIYVDDLWYEDIRRFSSLDEIVEEILRIIREIKISSEASQLCTFEFYCKELLNC